MPTGVWGPKPSFAFGSAVIVGASPGASLPTHQAIFVANHSSTVDTFHAQLVSVENQRDCEGDHLVSHHWPIGLLAGFSVDRSPEPNSECGQPATACEAHHPGSHQPLAYARGNLVPGRVLARFKTPGFVHLAVATRLPVVPIVPARYLPVVRPAGPLQCRAGEVIVEVLPTIDTGGWQPMTLGQLASSVE